MAKVGSKVRKTHYWLGANTVVDSNLHIWRWSVYREEWDGYWAARRIHPREEPQRLRRPLTRNGK